MLRAGDVSFSINDKALLKEASLDIRPGEVTVILGPNGAGKSTFMKLLCGDLVPDKGSVSLDGCLIENIERREVAQRRAMMPQSSNIAFPFTVLEIVMIGRSPHVSRRESVEDLAIVRAAMTCTGVSHLESRNYNTLSGGEQQRVQLARALAQLWNENSNKGSARYLLLDEPVASMDIAHQHETLRIAKNFAKKNVGVLVILHDINLASMYADRIAIFEEGEIRRQGPPEHVLDDALIKAVFNIDVVLERHPTLDCPMMVAIPNLLSTTNSRKTIDYVGAN